MEIHINKCGKFPNNKKIKMKNTFTRPRMKHGWAERNNMVKPLQIFQLYLVFSLPQHHFPFLMCNLFENYF